ncbi:zinc finger CCCH domain-containing protein 13-like isoform X2 [Ptychodera flava]|uniref:zinc finger CCCH domain-containing protein 13-like isoform X2 n=1 Tax=Ptychodera flava TaxID=63121 RepID=UPI003969CA05
MSTRLSNAIERPPSEQLSDLHVYVIPSESWNEKFRSAYNEVINESVSAGFVRVFPEITVFALRDEIEEQLGYDVLPKEYVFLKSVGRCLTQVKGRQEIDLKVKNFLPPLAYLPEIFVLPGQRDNVPLALPSTETYKSQRHKAVTGGDVDGFSQPGHNSATPDPFSIEHHYSQKTPLQEEGQEGYLAPLSATPPQTPDVVPVESPLQRKTKVAGKDANRSGRSDTYTNNTNEDSGIADDVEEELERPRQTQEKSHTQSQIHKRNTPSSANNATQSDTHNHVQTVSENPNEDDQSGHSRHSPSDNNLHNQQQRSESVLGQNRSQSVAPDSPLGSQFHRDNSHQGSHHSNDHYGNDYHGNNHHDVRDRSGNDHHGNDHHGNNHHGSDHYGNNHHGNEHHGRDRYSHDHHGNDHHGNDHHTSSTSFQRDIDSDKQGSHLNDDMQQFHGKHSSQRQAKLGLDDNSPYSDDDIDSWKRREQEEEERRRREEQERLRRLEEERREQRRQQQEEERRQYQEEQRRREREDQEARERLERAERDAKERLKLQEEEREREELERQREQLLRLQEEQQAREQRERERRNREEIERRQRELEDQIREEEERKRQEEERKKRELLQKQQKAIPSAPEQVSRRKNRLDTDSAKERRRDEKERLLDDLQRVRQDRQDTEREREDLVRRAKTLQNRTQHKRNRARDAWKKMYFEEKKKTPPLEQEVNRLRHSLDLQHKKYVNQIEGKEGRRKNAYNQPSEKTNLKVQIAKHQHDLEELRRRVENTKMKLTTEMKLRNQAETELRALRAELTQKKINVTLSRSQQLQALQESEESMSYMSPRSPLPTRRHGGLSPRIQ